MAYLGEDDIKNIGFKSFGKNIKISTAASIYNPEEIEIGDFCRIDDFCIISGAVSIGSYVHITPMCMLAGGIPGLRIGDFSTLAYGVKIFSQSDDYSGESMCNSLIPKKFKNESFRLTTIGRQVIIGAGATILPGADVGDGCAVGAMSLVLGPLAEWGIYAGVPVRRIRERSKQLLKLEKLFMDGVADDSI